MHQLTEKIRRGEPIPLPLAILLQACTPIQRLGMWLRLREPTVNVKAHVISFGNLTAGGTGKTPAVIERARAEVAAGKKVAVLTRGYGTKQRNEPFVVTAHDVHTPAEIGDEPALILRRVPEVLIVKYPDRVAAAQKAVCQHHCDTLILDDAFQYVRLERDENVLLIDARNPFGNGHIIPRGILREPIKAAARATHIILTRCDQAQNLDPLLETLHHLCPNTPIRKTCHAPSRLWRLCDNTDRPLEDLRGLGVTALCGIAQPETFFATLEHLGAHIVERRPYPDHAHFPPQALAADTPIITTEKDAMRLCETPPDNLYALAIDLRDID